jgi:hypothetical protein
VEEESREEGMKMGGGVVGKWRNERKEEVEER